MNIFGINKIMTGLDKMVDNAVEGKPIENGFDETKMSALETKLSHYLAMNNATRLQLSEEKQRINELISDISHQTKTPIANILLYAQLLEESNLPQREIQCVQSLVNQAEKLNFLIASLVKTSRLETGILSLFPKENLLKETLDSVMLQAMPKAQNKGLALTCEPTEINAIFDPKWTAEALGNIVDNAIKYTHRDGKVSIMVTAYQLFCRIDIADNGIGMSEEDMPKIFTRFYRSSAASEQEGVGLGLYLARKIVASEGGYIKVKSNLQQGSIFSVFLPMKR